MVCLLFGSLFANATVNPISLFTNNIILQRCVFLHIRGVAKDGETITVAFAGKQRTVLAANGNWLQKYWLLKQA